MALDGGKKIFFPAIGSILIWITIFPLLSAQTNEETLETIIKGMSYNESFIKSAIFDLNFEYYDQAEKYDLDIIKAQIREEAEKRGLSSEEIEKVFKGVAEDIQKREADPRISGSSRKVGEARFFIKDNRIRTDVEYTKTIFKGPVDPHSEKEEEQDSQDSIIEKTQYYSPNDSYFVDREGGQLITGEGKTVWNPFIFPLKFGFNMYWSNDAGIELYSTHLQKLLKEGKLKLAGQEEINGSMCYVVEVSFPEDNSRSSFWIDPNKGYTVSKLVNRRIVKQEDKEREFVGVECFYTVKYIDGVWVPDEGVEKYYGFLDEFCEKLGKPYCKKIGDIRQYVRREERIKITNCVLNTVADKDVQVPDIDSGEYRSIVDTKTNELIDIPLSRGEE